MSKRKKLKKPRNPHVRNMIKHCKGGVHGDKRKRGNRSQRNRRAIEQQRED